MSAGFAATRRIHGDKEDVVPWPQSEVFAERLEQAGVPVKLVIRKDGGHSWADFWRVDSSLPANWFDQDLGAAPSEPREETNSLSVEWNGQATRPDSFSVPCAGPALTTPATNAAKNDDPENLW